jgi:hypothetical protein
VEPWWRGPGWRFVLIFAAYVALIGAVIYVMVTVF